MQDSKTVADGFPGLCKGDLSVAYALLRRTAGFAASLTSQFAGTPLPHFAVQGFGYLLPWAEAVIGLLVFFGGLTRLALIAGALVMVALTFGTCLRQDWNVAGLQLIYSAVYFILIGLLRHNAFSVDALLSRNRD
jgi:thiosulfate dehydrogenase [quinone] large subunit